MAQITLKDVAKQAGVSFKTVSRVINHEPNVAAKTSEKVKKAIAELNYVPNSAARNLSRGKAMAIGLVAGWPVNSPYTSTLIEQTLTESMANGYNLALFSREDGISQKIVNAYLGKQVDGVILDTNAADDQDLINQINSLNVPYVVIHPNQKNGLLHASYVQINNITAARQAIDYLIEIGHRSIGFVCYKSGLNQEDERLSGYRLALTEAGIPYRNEWVYLGSGLPYKVGFTGAMHLVSNHTELTAIAAGTDEIAMGTLGAIRQMGLRIPDDISVIGFDDISYASMIIPPLTTIHQPIDEIARIAVEQLIHVIDDPCTEPIDIMLPTRLVVRDTCKPPRIQPASLPVS